MTQERPTKVDDEVHEHNWSAPLFAPFARNLGPRAFPLKGGVIWLSCMERDCKAKLTMVLRPGPPGTSSWTIDPKEV